MVLRIRTGCDVKRYWYCQGCHQYWANRERRIRVPNQRTCQLMCGAVVNWEIGCVEADEVEQLEAIHRAEYVSKANFRNQRFETSTQTNTESRFQNNMQMGPPALPNPKP